MYETIKGSFFLILIPSMTQKLPCFYCVDIADEIPKKYNKLSIDELSYQALDYRSFLMHFGVGYSFDVPSRFEILILSEY